MSLKEVESVLLARIGLQAETLGKDAVRTAMRARMSALGLPDGDAYLQALRTSPRELQALVEEVVISETWFFREPAAYRALRERLASRWAGGTVQVLSIPCATGEEPYSVAMTLLDAGHRPADVSVQGVDVSENALSKATAARYGRNSFRGDLLQYERYFEQRDGAYCVVPLVRDRVSLRQGNVLDPKLLAGSKFHAIFCRNLLIYLDRRSRAAALENLVRLLRPDGVLFVGHSEAGDVAAHGLERTGDPKCFAFLPGPLRDTPRRQRRSVRDSDVRQALARPLSRPVSMQKPARSHHSVRPKSLRPSAPDPTAAWLDEARSLADRGALHEALSACKRALVHAPHSASAHSLLGIVQRALGDLSEARKSFARALEIDHAHYEALVHLGLLCEGDGDLDSARSYRTRASAARGVQ